MKRVFMIILALVISMSLAACGITITPAPGVSGTVSDSPELTPAATPTATPTANASPLNAGSVSAKSPTMRAAATCCLTYTSIPRSLTLTKTARLRRLTFTAGSGSSTLQIGANTYHNRP